MTYKPVGMPTTKEIPELRDSIDREFLAVAQAFQLTDMMTLLETHVAPTRPRTGLVVFADGSDWNPGSGAGVYVYRGAAWHFLG